MKFYKIVLAYIYEKPALFFKSSSKTFWYCTHADGSISSSSILLAQSTLHNLKGKSCSPTELFYQGNAQTIREWLTVAISRALHQGEDSLLELTKQICCFLQVLRVGWFCPIDIPLSNVLKTIFIIFLLIFVVLFFLHKLCKKNSMIQKIYREKNINHRNILSHHLNV